MLPRNLPGFLIAFGFPFWLITCANMPGKHKDCYQGIVTFQGDPHSKIVRGWDLGDCEIGDKILVQEVRDDTGCFHIYWYSTEINNRFNGKDTTIISINPRTQKITAIRYRTAILLSYQEETNKAP